MYWLALRESPQDFPISSSRRSFDLKGVRRRATDQDEIFFGESEVDLTQDDAAVLIALRLHD